MKGKLYLVNVKLMNRVPSSVPYKLFIVRSCKNSDYYTRLGWSIAPQISPNPSLFSTYLNLQKSGQWNVDAFNNIYAPRFMEQMTTDDVMRKVLNNVKALLDIGQDVAFMCYCDSKLCHRFLLGDAYKQRGYEVIDLCEGC